MEKGKQIGILVGVAAGLFLLGFAGTEVVKERGVLPEPKNTQEKVERAEDAEKKEEALEEKEVNIPEESQEKPIEPQEGEPEEVNKTKSYIANLKELLEGDPGRSILVCGGEPCQLLTQKFEIPEDGHHFDCGGLTLAPAPGTKVGAYIKADGIIIENCVFDGFDTAIEIEGANAVITKNTIKNSAGNGILVKGQKAAIFENTIESNKGAGIFVAGESNEHAIMDNGIRKNNTQGLHVLGGSALTIFGNTITGNKSEGVWLSGNARDNLFFKNTIRENGGECGIFLSAINGASPSNNRILENTIDKLKTSCL